MDGNDREVPAAGHPAPEELERFLAGDLPAEPKGRLVAHLLAGCSRCEEILWLLEGGPLAAKADTYELPFAWARARAEDFIRALDAARQAARSHLAAFLAGEAQEIDPLERTPLDQWAWCELLLEAAAEIKGADPARAVDLAESAALGADLLQADLLPPALLADFQARTRADLANLRRVANDLDGAEAALGEALARSAAGTGDPLLLARLLNLAGSLFRTQRRFAEALEALGMACRLYAWCGEYHQAGRVLVIRAGALILDGRPEDAIADLAESFALLDLSRDPGLNLAAVHNGLLALVDLGHHEAVAGLLAACLPLYEAAGSPLDRVCLLGLQAKVAEALGDPRQAETCYRAEKAGFEEAGLFYDAAVISLDLAALLLDEGRPAEVLELVDEMLVSFRQRNIRRESCAAVLLLRRALGQDRATAALARRVAGRLREIRPGQS